MFNFQQMIENLNRFRDERDWRQFHKPKDLAISLSLEASELLEHFQWKNGVELEAYLKEHKEEISDEMADVLNYLVILSYELGIDLFEAHEKKLEKNRQKYPVEKSKGSAKKYTDYQ